MKRFFSCLRLLFVVAVFASFSQARAATTITLNLDGAPPTGPTVFATGADVTGKVTVSGMANPAVIKVAIDANHSVTLQGVANMESRAFAIGTNGLPAATTYNVTATNTEVSVSTPPAVAPLSLVNNARLQYQKSGAWLELPGTLYLQRGSSLALRAVQAANPAPLSPLASRLGAPVVALP